MSFFGSVLSLAAWPACCDASLLAQKMLYSMQFCRLVKDALWHDSVTSAVMKANGTRISLERFKMSRRSCLRMLDITKAQLLDQHQKACKMET